MEDTVVARPPRADQQVLSVLREQMRFDPRREPAGQAARERWRNLGALAEAATTLADADPDVTYAQLVTALLDRANAGAATPHGDAGAVTLLTLHAAKGLEFEAVFLVGLEEGLLPISHARNDEAIEEERRLLYVGVTRARRHLELSWSLQRPGYSGKLTTRRPSRFLYNLGPGAPTKGGAQKSAPAKRPTKTQLPSDADPVIADRLRAWRRERASADEVPAFVVFGDKTLIELAQRRPRSERELLHVSGLGPTKVARYGADILAVLAQR
jgi:DNA helicase-2/ATP-dependent DNA helicase PcrA